MTQSLYRIHGTWAQAYATLAANGLPGIEESMDGVDGVGWLDLDIDGPVRRVTKGRHIKEAFNRGTLVRVDIWQFDLTAGLDDADPGNSDPDKRAQTPVTRGPHLNLSFDNDDYRDVVNAAWLAEPAQNHDTPGAMVASWALQGRGTGKPEVATVHQLGTVALIVSEHIVDGVTESKLIHGPRYVFSG